LSTSFCSDGGGGGGVGGRTGAGASILGLPNKNDI